MLWGGCAGLTRCLTSDEICDKTCLVRIELASGTTAEIVRVPEPTMGLVIIPDLFGLRPLFDDLVARLAHDWNMSVCAIDHFVGQNLGSDPEKRVAALPFLDDANYLRDVHEAADELGTKVTALMGFCMGGMYCLKSAGSQRFDRIVSFYGMIKVPEAWRGRAQREPLGYMIMGDAEKVLAIVGDKDPYTPLPDVDELRSTGAVVQIYADAEHGFAHDASRPSHRPEDAADAFSRAREWMMTATS